MATPRHAVQMKWASMTALSKTRGLRLTLTICPAFDSAQGRQLNLEEKDALAIKYKEAAETNGTNMVDCLVMSNVSTDQMEREGTQWT